MSFVQQGNLVTLKGGAKHSFVQQANLAMPKGGAKLEPLFGKVIWSCLKVELSMSFCSAKRSQIDLHFLSRKVRRVCDLYTELPTKYRHVILRHLVSTL